MLVGPTETVNQSILIKQALLGSSLPIILSLYHNVVVSGDSSLPGVGPLSEFFLGSCKGGKELSLICWALIAFELKIILIEIKLNLGVACPCPLQSVQRLFAYKLSKFFRNICLTQL